MQYKVHAAKTNLSKLIDAALAGEEVIIAKGDQTCGPACPDRKEVGLQIRRPSRILRELIPDFLEPMPEDELRLWEGGD